MNFPAIKSIFKEAIPTLEKFSPTIAAAIGGPPGLAISFVIPMLAKAFGADSHNLNDIVKAIVKDVDAPIKLEALEHQNHDWLCAIMDSVNNLVAAEINIRLDWNKKI